MLGFYFAAFVFIESWQCEILRKSHQQPVCGRMFSYREEYVCAARGKIALILTFSSYFLHFQGFHSELITSVGTWVGNSIQLAVDFNSKYAQFSAKKSGLCYYTNYRMPVTFMFSIWIDIPLLNKPEVLVRIYEKTNNPLKGCFLLLYWEFVK